MVKQDLSPVPILILSIGNYLTLIVFIYLYYIIYHFIIIDILVNNKDSYNIYRR